MDEPAIKSVPKTTKVPDALKKREPEPRRKLLGDKKEKKKKDPKRIIDTYA